jgi:hypothetical protein
MKKIKKTKRINTTTIMIVVIVGVITFSFGSIIYNSFFVEASISRVSDDANRRKCENCSAQAGEDVFHYINNPETEEVWCDTHQRFEQRIKNDSENR